MILRRRHSLVRIDQSSRISSFLICVLVLEHIRYLTVEAYRRITSIIGEVSAAHLTTIPCTAQAALGRVNAGGSELLTLALELGFEDALRVLNVSETERGTILRDYFLWICHESLQIGGARQSPILSVSLGHGNCSLLA